VLTEAPESLEIRTIDDRALGAELCEPRGRRIVGTAIFAHPMFASKTVFARPRGGGVARLFLEAGWRTLAFDFRGHGESTTHGEPRTPEEQPWGYDDLVRIDLPAVVEAARARWPRSRLVVVGHSLGGHVALAAQGSGLMAADALIVAGANLWMRHLEPSRRRWLAKLAASTGMAIMARNHRYFPARALRLGSDDEAKPYIDDITRFAMQGRWTSRDGAIDYEAGLATIQVPTFALSSTGDTFYCRPESVERLMATVPRCTHHRVTRDDQGGPAPGHMALVTSATSREGWRRGLEWLRSSSAAPSSSPSHPR
jgi:predicted alpha/beta hydrolase